MGGAAAFVARGTLGAHFLCAPSLPAGLLSPSWLRKPLEHPARRTPPRHPSGIMLLRRRIATSSVLTHRGISDFLKIMPHMINLRLSGGILLGTFGRRMGDGLDMSLRFFGWGYGPGM
jgi:hypothetical protein